MQVQDNAAVGLNREPSEPEHRPARGDPVGTETRVGQPVHREARDEVTPAPAHTGKQDPVGCIDGDGAEAARAGEPRDPRGAERRVEPAVRPEAPDEAAGRIVPRDDRPTRPVDRHDEGDPGLRRRESAAVERVVEGAVGHQPRDQALLVSHTSAHDDDAPIGRDRAPSEDDLVIGGPGPDTGDPTRTERSIEPARTRVPRDDERAGLVLDPEARRHDATLRVDVHAPRRRERQRALHDAAHAERTVERAARSRGRRARRGRAGECEGERGARGERAGQRLPAV